MQLIRLAETKLSNEEEDQVSWMKQGNKKFSVKSAFTLLRNEARIDIWNGWKRIWKLRVQERTKILMWLLAHDRVLSNWARWNRQIAKSPGCDRCDAAKEDDVHAVRDCNKSRELWLSFLPPALNQKILSYHYKIGYY